MVNVVDWGGLGWKAVVEEREGRALTLEGSLHRREAGFVLGGGSLDVGEHNAATC